MAWSRPRVVAAVLPMVALLSLGVPAPAGARPPAVTGTYSLFAIWDGTWPANLTLRLWPSGRCSLTPWVLPRHNSCTWSAGAKDSFLMTVSNPELPTATYNGVFTATGINSSAGPGTVTNSVGATGTWYATRR
jgi:hypothetical protein